MSSVWRKKIAENLALVHEQAGPEFVVMVTGNENDARYWRTHTSQVRGNLFRADERVHVTSVAEGSPRGNFLGTLKAWDDARRAPDTPGSIPDISFMSMVFGKGKRLSPFCQALGNRKAAFPTPMKAEKLSQYLCTGDLSCLYSNNWVQHLRQGGFQGVLVKWGDEAILPGLDWPAIRNKFQDMDLIRFVSQTEPTEVLAREKDWFVINRNTGLIERQLSRQPLSSLQSQLGNFGTRQYGTAVNLGSIAVSYTFLEAAREILAKDMDNPAFAADWDPFIMMALLSPDESAWQINVLAEEKAGRAGIRDAEKRYPGFYAAVSSLRSAVKRKTGRPFKIGFLDFGDVFWVDLGLQITLRQTLAALTADSEIGFATREFFGVPHARDAANNIIVRSPISERSRIRNSVILDSSITGPDVQIEGGVVVGGMHRNLLMPEGGAAVFCAVSDMRFTGENTIAFRSVAPELSLAKGERHTSIFLSESPETFISNESVVDYSGDTYSKPIFGNRLSFEEAGSLAEQVDAIELEDRWKRSREKFSP